MTDTSRSFHARYRNTILERQKIYQADPRPVYQRVPRSRLYMGECIFPDKSTP